MAPFCAAVVEIDGGAVCGAVEVPAGAEPPLPQPPMTRKPRANPLRNRNRTEAGMQKIVFVHVVVKQGRRLGHFIFSPHFPHRRSEAPSCASRSAIHRREGYL